MSTYALAQRGVASITSADTSPKSITLSSSIKTGSSQIHATVRDRRQNAALQRGAVALTSADTSPKDVTITAVDLAASRVEAQIRDKRRDAVVQRGAVALTDADTSPKDVTITAVDVAATFARGTWRENRAGNARGATVQLLNSTTVRIAWPGTLAGGETLDVEWEVVEQKPPRHATVQLQSATNVRIAWDGTLAAGETIDVEYQVIEEKPRRSATARIVDATHVEIAWDGTLAAGETIDVAWEVWDIAPLGDDIKEILFRLMRALGYLGENCMQDLCQYDDAGNCIQYRLRIFDSRANAEAADLDLPLGSGLQTGEMARAIVSQDIDSGKNDRIDIIQVLDTVIATPGVG